MSKKKNYKATHAKKQKGRIWIWLFMIFVFLVAAGAGALFASSSLFDTHRLDRSSKKNHTLLVAKDKATVMIMGVDERSDDVGRSDTLMFAAIDPKKKHASLLSIPRDTRVRIGKYGWDKINSAYAYGGREITQSTVEDLLDTPVDHYICINTRSFPRIIDAIGGVDINVEKRMYYVDEWDDAIPGGLVIDLYPGMQHMNGLTAMGYVRYRDEEGDIGRIERQQKFMRAVMDKVTSPSIIINLPSVISEITNSIDTDLSMRQLLEFAGALKEAQANGLHTEMVEGRPVYIDGISYWIPDIKRTRMNLADMLGITMSQHARDEMEREDMEYESSVPADAEEAPENDQTIGRILNPRPDKDRSDKSKDGSSEKQKPVTPQIKPSTLPPVPQKEEREDDDEDRPQTRSENEAHSNGHTATPSAPVSPTPPSPPTPPAPSASIPNTSSGKGQ